MSDACLVYGCLCASTAALPHLYPGTPSLSCSSCLEWSSFCRCRGLITAFSCSRSGMDSTSRPSRFSQVRPACNAARSRPHLASPPRPPRLLPVILWGGPPCNCRRPSEGRCAGAGAGPAHCRRVHRASATHLTLAPAVPLALRPEPQPAHDVRLPHPGCSIVQQVRRGCARGLQLVVVMVSSWL